ncbi:hypothetical protein WL86_11115 [Burkholderia diffusa]|nr:hypothetical protein WL87_08930 [Burkholderia diffusa]KWF42301.1 hypothetical protein WL85_03460 [Burkholderia diffusa]KWF43404.1 hypothetical protein WL86_11115 [Burkholderia diffusa]
MGASRRSRDGRIGVNGAAILITGGAGFLGSHPGERFVNARHDVMCVDNFHTGSKRNVAHLSGRVNFEVIRHDVWLPLYVEADRVFNMTCPASPDHCPGDPVAASAVTIEHGGSLIDFGRDPHPY